MRIEELINRMEPAPATNVLVFGAVEGEFTVSDEPPLCAHCAEEIDFMADREFNRWTFVSGGDVFYGFHVERFCSASCRTAWWDLGTERDLFEIHTPGEIGTRDHRRPSFLWASPDDPRWETSWAQHTLAVPVRVVVADEDPGQAIQEVVFERDGQLERIEIRCSLLPLIRAIPAGTEVEKRTIPEQIVEEREFADPVAFHAWWRGVEDAWPRRVEETIIHGRTFEEAPA